MELTFYTHWSILISSIKSYGWTAEASSHISSKFFVTWVIVGCFPIATEQIKQGLESENLIEYTESCTCSTSSTKLWWQKICVRILRNYLVWLQYLPMTRHRTVLTSPTLTDPFFILSESCFSMYISCAKILQERQSEHT